MGKAKRLAYARASVQPAESLRRKLTVLLGALVCAALGACLLVGAVSQAHTELALRDHGVDTQGRIIAVGQGRISECEVSYRDVAGDAHEAWVEGDCGHMEVGQDVPVKFVASKPTTVVAVGGALSLNTILIDFALGLLLFAAGVVGVLSFAGVFDRWRARRLGHRSSAA
ncbi:hypothetical protein KDL01_34565 [Actinospica durhamensis]|uniref:DUF3592 domain-containing protein n=1 Tax=Actinospica durhamensis TaxID=1508375 RepID=A0A941EWA5_9ACTN|nr:DUF3592 domain-containing protein [Actinospica durhamensis]MBR7838441.1 hypothetical protein [Actinospica durhamensis]